MGPVTTIPPHPHPPAQPEARRTGAVVDGVAAAVLTTLQIVGSALTWWVTLFWAMATDGCFEHCREEFVYHAWKVTWGGLALGLVITVVGLWVAAKRQTTLSVWPVAGIAVGIIAVVIGAHLINIAAGN
ncbi:hypothetical protein MINS_21590 [Mycolicibacterium insubricum]|jgi:hypothetical protein|nr:hypothetical protein MINS_21590 [Mycolicibacterium insubricum]